MGHTAHHGQGRRHRSIQQEALPDGQQPLLGIDRQIVVALLGLREALLQSLTLLPCRRALGGSLGAPSECSVVV